ncbi:hypothetical protein [Xanthomonas sp. F1]
MAVATCWQQERAQVRSLTQDVQHVVGETMKPALVDQDYTGESPAEAAQEEGSELHVLKLAEAKKGVALLSRRRVLERSFGWIDRFRRLARDDERPRCFSTPEFITRSNAVGRSILRWGAHGNSNNGNDFYVIEQANCRASPLPIGLQQCARRAFSLPHATESATSLHRCIRWRTTGPRNART